MLNKVAFALLPSLLALPAVASAEEVASSSGSKMEVIRPSTRPMFVTFSLSPALNVSNAASQLKIAETFGYHFSGDGSGLAVGGELQQSFGSNLFVLQMGPKAWYDIPISSDLGLYIAPTAMLGLAYASSSFGGSDVGFNMQFGAEAKAIINDRVLVFFRPFTLDIAMSDSVSVRYDLVFGAGATF